MVLLAAPLAALPFHEDTFTYDDGPLAGQYLWMRGVLDPSADTPSDYLTVENGAVKFDWTWPERLNQAVRVQWLEDGVTSGTVYAAFDMRVTQAPLSLSAGRPGFLMFDRSGGGQPRGHVGIRQGTVPNTFQLGLSSSSQLPENYAYVNQNLQVNTTYRVMVGYDTSTGQTRLWIGRDDPTTQPDLLVYGSVSTNVRRIQLRLSNTGGQGGFSNMGVFYIDNLVVSMDGPSPQVTFPDRSKVFLFLLAGQSNMAGRGAVEPEDRVTDPRIVYYTADRQWRLARDPLHWDRPGNNGVGPALSFARTLLPELPEDAVIGLIPTAQGSTSIQEWTKTYSGSETYYNGRYLYQNAVERTLEAMQYGTLAGVLWNQGENDGTASQQDGGVVYRQRLHQIIADMREDFGRPNLPFIASTLGPWRAETSTAMNQVYLSLPSEVPYTATVNTLDPEVAPLLVNNPDDTPHYLTPSYRLLGQLYAAQALPLVRSQLLEPKAPQLRIARGPVGLTLNWEQLPWRTGLLEAASSLSGTWEPLQTVEGNAFMQNVEVLDQNGASEQQRFYRVRIGN